jgi:ActR/RegA family two-component response regulator
MTDQNKSIVLVDDDKFLLDMYSMKFQQAGWAVQACLSVKAAPGEKTKYEAFGTICV